MSSTTDAASPQLRPFENLDNDTVFSTYIARLQDVTARNFIVDFTKERAMVAFNLETAQFKTTLKARQLGRTYGFSPRLLSLMGEEPLDRPILYSEESPTPRQRKRDWFREWQEQYLSGPSTDEEKQVESPRVSNEYHDPVADLNHYRLVNEVWHFSSVDWGEKYLCLGYNSLHGGSSSTFGDLAKDDATGDVPKGLRLWSWLILCNDGTVISIHEDAFPGQTEISQNQKIMLKIVRRNLCNVFRELSHAPSAIVGQKPISILRIRGAVKSTGEEQSESTDATVDRDAPSLLFFYLFDDWNSSYGLVARKEQQYGEELEDLRREMIEKPLLTHIDRLYHIGRQLAVLKRMYQSYKLIIDRVLDRQKPQDGRQKSPLPVEDPSDMTEERHVLLKSTETTFAPSLSVTDPKEVSSTQFGASLAPASIVRFERMRDRIGLYALSEIHECLDMKEALVMMAFNLIGMKESQAIERLTRITILLAKVTILFLPVNLMTQYFSVQIVDLTGVYSYKTYWACFGIIMFLSILLLFFFGRLSGTVEGKVIYQSVGGHMLDLGRGIFRVKKRRVKRS